MSSLKTEEKFREIFREALRLFNDWIDSGVNEMNTELVLYRSENGVSVFEALCKKRLPKHRNEPHLEEGFFTDAIARAFVEEKYNCIMLRADLPLSEEYLLEVLLHEISHLYCTRNEIYGGDFFEKYCRDDGREGTVYFAGYEIWREAVADIMASSVLSDYSEFSLAMVYTPVKAMYASISSRSKLSRKQLSSIISYIMLSDEVAGTENWSEASDAISRIINLDDLVLMDILKLVFQNLHTEPFWGITPDFIYELGRLYLSFISLKDLRNALF